MAFHQILHDIRQIKWADAVHGAAQAGEGRQEFDHFVGIFVLQAVDEVHLRADCPLATCWRLVNLLDDVGSRADKIGGIHHLHHTFGVNNHVDIGMMFAPRHGVFGAELLMNAAMSAPQDNLGVADLVVGQATIGLEGIPEYHLL